VLVVDRCQRPAQQQLEAAPAGIDDPGAFQDGQQAGRARHRRMGLLDRAAQHELERVVDLERLLRRAGHVARHGQDRALNRMGHGREGGLAAALEGCDELRPGDTIGAADGVAHAAQELRQDHAAVAARTHQRSQAQRGGDARHCSLAGRHALRLGDRGLERGEHVRAGVTVGHGEDVERVDLVELGVEHGRGMAQRREQVVAVPGVAVHRPSAFKVNCSIGRPSSRCTA
jgi:hypothetical protein